MQNHRGRPRYLVDKKHSYPGSDWNWNFPPGSVAKISLAQKRRPNETLQEQRSTKKMLQGPLRTVPDWSEADEKRERQLEMYEKRRYGETILENPVPEINPLEVREGSLYRFPKKLPPQHSPSDCYRDNQITYIINAMVGV